MPDLLKFLRKTYRDSYLQTHVRSGIAYQIRALREKSGLSQIEFAQSTGKKQSTISRLENTEYGKVSVQTLLDIACARGVALVVRFVSYPDFFEQTADMSQEALQPQTIDESVDALERRNRAVLQLDNPIARRSLAAGYGFIEVRPKPAPTSALAKLKNQNVIGL